MKTFNTEIISQAEIDEPRGTASVWIPTLLILSVPTWVLIFWIIVQLHAHLTGTVPVF